MDHPWRALLFGPGLLAACSGAPFSAAPPKTDAEWQTEVAATTYDALLVDIRTVVAAAEDIAAYAPTPEGRGWDPNLDASAIATMKGALERARGAYERIEGAVALSFPALDFTLDSRYEDMLTTPAGDPYLFDDQGFVGMDAVERILYANEIPPGVVAYEKGIPGYVPAAFPATAAEASDFKDKLAARLVNDASALQAGWTLTSFDATLAFNGLVAIIQEQRFEVDEAPMNAEESRYSQTTMNDLRANLQGTEAIYGIFRPWLLSKDGGSDADGKVTNGIVALENLYAGVAGAAIPPVPPTWNAASPSAGDLASDYGRLYQGVVQTVQPTAAQMSGASAMLGLSKN
jgi:iron uptake system component EfeO